MLYNILKDIRRKFAEPRVYALTIEGKDFVFMDLQVAYSLEEAFDQAQKEFLRLNPSFVNKPLNSRIHFFCVKTFQELFKGDVVLKPENNSVPTIPLKNNPPVNPLESSIETKNSLMRKIVNDKDKGILLLEQNLTKFTEEEKRYLLDRIEENKKK